MAELVAFITVYWIVLFILFLIPALIVGFAASRLHLNGFTYFILSILFTPLFSLPFLIIKAIENESDRIYKKLDDCKK